MSGASGGLAIMDDDTRRRPLRAVIGEAQAGRGRVRCWTSLEAAERAGLVLSHARRRLRELREQDPPPVWGDIDADTGEELWWLLPRGLKRTGPPRDGRAPVSELATRPPGSSSTQRAQVSGPAARSAGGQ